MKYISSFLKFLWVIWGAIAFMLVISILTPIFLILILIFGRKIRHTLVGVNYWFTSPVVLRMVGIFIRTHNRESMPTKGTAVLISNHRSMADVLINAEVSPLHGFYLSKKSMTKFPVFGLMVKSLGILVDRKDEASRKKSYEYMVRTIREGYPIFIYPEGTRNRTGLPLKEFYDGAFRLAIETQVPIIAQTIVGVDKVYSPDTPFQLSPGRVDVYFDGPFETKGLTMADVETYKATIKAAMEKHLVTN